MKNTFKKGFFLMLSIGLFSGCVNDTYDTPKFDPCVNSGLTKTKEVVDVYTMAINPKVDPITGISNSPTYTEDDIIEGYVVSSDEGGNFYQSMYIQPTDGSKGFNFSAQVRNIYNQIEPGRKVFLKLKDLSFANPKIAAIGLIFGAAPTDSYAVDRLAALKVDNHLIASCNRVSEEDIVHKISINQVGDAYLNTLVEFDDIQFTGESAGETFDLVRTDDFDSNTFVTQDGNKDLTVRTSRYANFAGYKISKNRGKIRGVLTKYGSTYQIVLRTERDVKMSNPRVDYHLPIMGNSIEYLPTLSENFESYASSSSGAIFPKYINDAFKGGKYWIVASFSSNKYLQMSSYSFNSGGTNTVYLALPIAFTPGKKFSFKSKDGFYNGDVLKVYYTKDYTPGSDFSKATLVDITSRFKIASGTTTGYASNFTNSGFYTIPANLTGNGFFIFEYNTAGRANVTTTIQIDDITMN